MGNLEKSVKLKTDESLSQRAIGTAMNILRNITVEPVMFLYFFSGNLDSISLSQLKIIKSCKHDFDFNETVCENLLGGNYTEENDMVQDKARFFVCLIVCLLIKPGIT